MSNAIAPVLNALLALHRAIPGAWSTEIRDGGGFSDEVNFSFDEETAALAFAATCGADLSYVSSVNGKTEWLDGDSTVAGIRVRISGPSRAAAKASEIAPANIDATAALTLADEAVRQ